MTDRITVKLHYKDAPLFIWNYLSHNKLLNWIDGKPSVAAIIYHALSFIIFVSGDAYMNQWTDLHIIWSG